MPLQTETINLADERDRLREEMEEVAEEQLEWMGNDSDVASTYAVQLRERGYRIEKQVNILEWAESEWGVDSVTLSGVTAGDVNLVEDIVDEHDGVRHRDAFVAVGTEDAPYVDHDLEATSTASEAQDEVMATVGNVTNLPLPYVRWAESRISELGQLGGEMGNEYTNLLLEVANSTEGAESG